MNAGRGIRRSREVANISLRQLAKDIGISASYLSDVELDKRNISIDMAIRITAALYKYMGYQIRDRFDSILISAGLYTAERDCLVRLWKMSKGQHVANRSLRNYRAEIYEALYGELDRAITGEKYGNRYTQDIAVIGYTSA